MSTTEVPSGKKTRPRSSKKAAAATPAPAAEKSIGGLSFYCTECQVRWAWSDKEGAHLCFECGSPFDVVTLGYFNDERVDKDGNYLTGFDPVETVPLSKETGYQCHLEVIQGQDLRWRVSIDSAGPDGAYFQSANIGEPGFTVRADALACAARSVADKWASNENPAGAGNRNTAIRELRDYVERLNVASVTTKGLTTRKKAKEESDAAFNEVTEERKEAAAEASPAKKEIKATRAAVEKQPVDKGYDQSAAPFGFIAISKIVPSPTNPRKHFDESKLQTLAASFADVGVLEPIVLRRLPGAKSERFEIVAGERRWRAAKIAKLETIPATLRDMTDAQVLNAQMIENFEREDLNPIEEARAFQVLTKPIAEGGGGFTQRQLAEKFQEANQKKASSQGFIANRIRLLDLPEVWQQKVISQEIMPTFARELLPYAKYPAVLKKLEKKKAETVQDWRRAINRAVEETGRSMRPARWSGDIDCCLFKAKDETLEQLDVVEVTWPSGTKQKIAMNVELWDRLQKEAKQKKKEREQTKLDSESKTPKKVTAAEAREAEKKKLQQFNRRLYEWMVTMKQQCIADRLEKADDISILKLILFFSAQGSYSARAHELQEEVDAISGQSHKRSHYGPGDAWKDLGLIDRAKLKTLARKLAMKWVCHVAYGNADIAPDEVDRIYLECGGDLKQDWRISKEFLELHNKNQLVDLALEWKCKTAELKLLGMKRGELIEHVLESCAGAKCPKSVWSLNPNKL